MFKRFQQWMKDQGEYTPTPRPLVQKIIRNTALTVVSIVFAILLFFLILETLIEILYWIA